jgi:serine/threonine protein phosphatase PrpC
MPSSTNEKILKIIKDNQGKLSQLQDRLLGFSTFAADFGYTNLIDELQIGKVISSFQVINEKLLQAQSEKQLQAVNKIVLAQIHCYTTINQQCSNFYHVGASEENYKNHKNNIEQAIVELHKSTVKIINEQYMSQDNAVFNELGNEVLNMLEPKAGADNVVSDELKNEVLDMPEPAAVAAAPVATLEEVLNADLRLACETYVNLAAPLYESEEIDDNALRALHLSPAAGHDQNVCINEENAYGLSVLGRPKVSFRSLKTSLNDDLEIEKERQLKNYKYSINQDKAAYISLNEYSPNIDTLNAEQLLTASFEQAQAALDAKVAENSGTTAIATVVMADNAVGHIITASVGDSYQFLVQYDRLINEWQASLMNTLHKATDVSAAEMQRLQEETINYAATSAVLTKDKLFGVSNGTEMTKFLGYHAVCDAVLKPNHTTNKPSIDRREIDLTTKKVFIVTCTDAIDRIADTPEKLAAWLAEQATALGDDLSVENQEEIRKASSAEKAFAKIYTERLVDAIYATGVQDNITVLCSPVSLNENSLQMVADPNGIYGHVVGEKVIQVVKQQVTCAYAQAQLKTQLNALQAELSQNFIENAAPEMGKVKQLCQQLKLANVINVCTSITSDLEKKKQDFEVRLANPSAYSKDQLAVIAGKHNAVSAALTKVYNGQIRFLQNAKDNLTTYQTLENSQDTHQCAKNISDASIKLKRTIKKAIIENIIDNPITKKHDNFLVPWAYKALNVLMAVTIVVPWVRIFAMDKYEAAFLPGRTDVRKRAYDNLDKADDIVIAPTSVAAVA